MGDQPGRPTKATALEVASRWIGEMDQETAQDYATALFNIGDTALTPAQSGTG